MKATDDELTRKIERPGQILIPTYEHCSRAGPGVDVPSACGCATHLAAVQPQTAPFTGRVGIFPVKTAGV